MNADYKQVRAVSLAYLRMARRILKAGRYVEQCRANIRAAQLELIAARKEAQP